MENLEKGLKDIEKLPICITCSAIKYREDKWLNKDMPLYDDFLKLFDSNLEKTYCRRCDPCLERIGEKPAVDRRLKIQTR